MGGVKKKPLAAMEKQQKMQAEEEKQKKGKEQKQQQQQKRLPFLLPKVSDEELVRALAPLKAVTIYSAAKALGVNASIALNLIRALENKKLLKRVGGFSGHYVWSLAKPTS